LILADAEPPSAAAFKAARLELRPATLPVGSRLIVIDPFSDDPVVITGSHTLSDGASRKNDEDLLIIRGNRALARECAVHIKGLVDHYTFRSRSTSVPELSHDDSWQKRFSGAETVKEIAFWMGTLAASVPVRRAGSSSQTPPGATVTKEAGTKVRKKAQSTIKRAKKSTAKKSSKSAKRPRKPKKPRKKITK